MANDGLRSLLEEFRRKNKIPALGGGVVTADGADVEVVGVRVRGGDDSVRRDDRWHIGSCAKSITAALYARLVERGSASWDATVPELFPDLAGAIDPAWGAITIGDVFVGQAGLPANLSKEQMRAAFHDERPLEEQRTEAAAAALAQPPRSPGRFLYSNLGYVVIGAAIERLARASYESTLRTHVLEPLRINSAGFGPPGHLWGHGGRMIALGPFLFDLGRGASADPEAVQSDNPPIMTPAGRLHLTLEDWAKFQRMLLTKGGDFLRPESVERLLTPGAGGGYRQTPGWAPAHNLRGASFGQQGSNTFWVATALIDEARERTAMVVCNEGRARLLRRTPNLAVQLLSQS